MDLYKVEMDKKWGRNGVEIELELGLDWIVQAIWIWGECISWVGPLLRTSPPKTGIWKKYEFQYKKLKKSILSEMCYDTPPD